MKGKKRLALIGMAAILALSLLGFGLGTTVFASDEQATDNATNESTPYETFLGKVADKLGLEYDVVQQAVQEARQEMMQDALQERLQEAVGEGLITQEQADEILQWMQNRPEALDQLDGFGFGGPSGGGMMMERHHRCGGF